MPFMRRVKDEERGAAAIIIAVALVVLFLAGAFAIDIGALVVRRQAVRDAMDSGVLAGAALLPGDPNGAKAAAIAYATENNKMLTPSAINVTFRCLIGDNGSGQPDLSFIPGACDPGSDGISGFTCDRGVCMTVCVPAQGDSCNTIVSESSENVPFRLAPIGGVAAGSTGLVKSGACSGFCGTVPKIPIDIGLIVDRTASMSATDLSNAKNAALAMLGYLDPKFDNVALGVIHRSTTASQCTGGGYGKSITTTEYGQNKGTWIAAPYPSAGFLNDYLRADGSSNPASALVKTINCLQTSSFSTSQGQTDIGSPITKMSDLLNNNGRAGVKKVLVVETDGEANLPTGVQPCGYAVQQGTRAKNLGIETFTIGFGIGGKTCVDDTSGTYRGGLVTKVLADIATGPSPDNGCVAAENTDGDHFFCEPKSGDLRSVFLRVAAAISATPRLVRLLN